MTRVTWWPVPSVVDMARDDLGWWGWLEVTQVTWWPVPSVVDMARDDLGWWMWLEIT